MNFNLPHVVDLFENRHHFIVISLRLLQSTQEFVALVGKLQREGEREREREREKEREREEKDRGREREKEIEKER